MVEAHTARPLRPADGGLAPGGDLHTDVSQLMVKVQRGTGTVKTLHNRVAGVNLFKSWNLFSQGYVLADFTTSATWTIYVEDYVSALCETE